jgi:nitrate reductase gamma subunit
MSLLEFARGPAFQWSLVIMLVGIGWRLAGIFLLPKLKDLSKPRSTASVRGGIRTVITRSVPPPEFEKKIRFQHITGYGWHIGYFVVVLLSAQHIEFFANILGFSWPHLPTAAIVAIAAITLALLVALLVRRTLHPVLKLISTADDYLSWLVTTVPLITGVMAYAHVGLRYELLLAIHILSVEALMIWFPLGKLMHLFLALPSRYQIGAAYERRGVQA